MLRPRVVPLGHARRLTADYVSNSLARDSANHFHSAVATVPAKHRRASADYHGTDQGAGDPINLRQRASSVPRSDPQQSHRWSAVSLAGHIPTKNAPLFGGCCGILLVCGGITDIAVSFPPIMTLTMASQQPHRRLLPRTGTSNCIINLAETSWLA